ncbi:unnamed protein product [Mytilus coruscus]|uniref:DZIP3-like HEPN domain-containing protein n=1 Tax=Mytilus coruscus TaxID=42192 RepID=A0A6J8A408_MYTCO|nr:unnamed protein product [Mytilus coruscus]
MFIDDDILRMDRQREANQNVQVHPAFNRTKLTTDEVHFLRVIHILFRVVYPVVRMTIDHKIKQIEQENELRKTRKRGNVDSEMETGYRNNETNFNDHDSDQLSKRVEELKNTSEEFYIEFWLARLEINKDDGLYPVESDTNESAMFSKIKHINKKATQIFDGKISEKQFNQYWDDIRQELLILIAELTPGIDMIDTDQDKKQLIGKNKIM